MGERESTWLTRRRFVLLGGAALLAACERQLTPSSTTGLPATTQPAPTTTAAPTTTTTEPTTTTSTAPPETTAPIQPAGSALANPSAMGYPDATNTGVPEGTSLQKVERTLDIRDREIRLDDETVATRPESGSSVWGPVTLHPDRTDIEGAEIVGRLRQRSTYPIYVTNSRIVAVEEEATTAFYQIHTAGAPTPPAKVYLADCTIWAGLGKAAAFGGWMEFLRCDISGGEDAIDLQTETHLRDCYVHDLERREGSHNDILQSGGVVNASVMHCTLLAAKKTPEGHGLEFPDGWYDPMNAVLMIGDYGGEIRNVRIEDCLVDGGNYTFNDNWRDDHPVNNIVIRGNRIGRHFRYGPRAIEGPAWVWEDNVWDDTGQSV